jgi:superfamily II DNA helicase RecQ
VAVNAVKQIFVGSPSMPTAGADPILLVRSTGGGKSAVRDVSGLLLGRIVLTIVPLLSLSADQTSKMAAFIQEIGLAPDPDGRVVQCINLDVLRDSRLNADVCQRLEAMKWDTADTTFLFSSPQKIVNSKKWQTTINRLIAAGTLSMVAVDECHLFASQGMEF